MKIKSFFRRLTFFAILLALISSCNQKNFEGKKDVLEKLNSAKHSLKVARSANGKKRLNEAIDSLKSAGLILKNAGLNDDYSKATELEVTLSNFEKLKDICDLAEKQLSWDYFTENGGSRYRYLTEKLIRDYYDFYNHLDKTKDVVQNKEEFNKMCTSSFVNLYTTLIEKLRSEKFSNSKIDFNTYAQDLVALSKNYFRLLNNDHKSAWIKIEKDFLKAQKNYTKKNDFGKLADVNQKLEFVKKVIGLF